MSNCMTEKLKPCPFCGGEAVLLEPNESSTFYRVGCNCAHCIGANAVWHAHTSEAEAIEAWNARAERTCYADEVTHRDCKYSVNRGWKERTCEFNVKDNMNETEGMGDVWIECSACHCVFDFYADEWLMKMSYCPNCGARVIGTSQKATGICDSEAVGE